MDQRSGGEFGNSNHENQHFSGSFGSHSSPGHHSSSGRPSSFGSTREYFVDYYTSPVVNHVVTPVFYPQVTPTSYPQITLQRSRWPAISRCLPILNVGIIILALVLIFSVFGSETLHVGVKEERILQASTIFVKSIDLRTKVNSSGTFPRGLSTSLLTFSKSPPLTRSIEFEEHFDGVSVRSDAFESWKFWLNKGSTVTVKLNVQKNDLQFVVIRGQSNVDEWKEAPDSFSDYVLRERVHGSQSFTVTVNGDGDYFFSLANFKNHPINGISLNFEVTSKLYDISGAKTQCTVLPARSCQLDLTWTSSSVGLLLTPMESESTELWQVTVGYSPRWHTYFWMIGLTWVATFVVAKIGTRREAARISSIIQPPYPSTFISTSFGTAQSVTAIDRVTTFQNRGAGIDTVPESSALSKAPIPEEWAVPNSGKGGESGLTWQEDDSKPLLPSGSSNNVCVICMDAAKDAIFIDCGHRATCYSCAQSLVSPKVCPICRKDIQKVIRVYDV